MKETRMPPAYSANLVANSGNTIYGVSVISVYNFKITFYVHTSVLPKHLVWLAAVIFKVNDNILG